METQKKILFISYDGMTDPLGQSQVIPYLLGLSNNGYKIFLLSCEKPAVFSKKKDMVNAMLQDNNIEWTPIHYTKNPPVLSTIIDIFKLKKAAKKIHAQHGIDMVHTRPGIPALVGLWMKKTMQVKFLNDIREFYADSRVEGGMWNVKNPLYKIIYRYFKNKEQEQVKKNDGIVCLTYAAEKIIAQWPEYKKDIPFEVIPCSADMDLFNTDTINATAKHSLKQELNISDTDIVISYLGSIGGWYLTDEMMAFCKVLSEKKQRIKFLFISPHRHPEILAAAAKQGIAADSIIIKKADRRQVPLLLSLSDFSIFFIKPCYSKQSSSPTKHGEIMAMGIPLITNRGVGDVESIVTKYNAGIVIDNFSAAAYETAAVQVFSKNSYKKNEIRQGAADFYSLQTAIEKYSNIYSKILN